MVLWHCVKVGDTNWTPAHWHVKVGGLHVLFWSHDQNEDEEESEYKRAAVFLEDRNGLPTIPVGNWTHIPLGHERVQVMLCGNDCLAVQAIEGPAR